MAAEFESVFVSFAIPKRHKGVMSLSKLRHGRIGGNRERAGYLAGEFPDGITTVEGAPVSAHIRVFLRSIDPDLDGALVAETTSLQNGTWRVDGLDTDWRYDVIGRRAGFNDVIMSNVAPKEL